MYRVFFYGTLKRGEPNENILKNPDLGTVKFIARARTVREFPLVIASEYNTPYLLYKPGYGNRIAGEVFDVADLAVLDDFEDYPRYYSRMEEEVELENGEITKAWLYALENFKPDLLERSLLSVYSSKELNGLAFRHGGYENPQHRNQVKADDESVLKWSVFLERDMHLVFVYGTLKRGEPNDHFWKDPRLGVVKFIAKAKTVQKFPLTIASEYNLPYLLFKPGCGSRIDGEIFEVENLSPLDEFEGYPRYYSRMEEQVKMEDGELTKAWLYTLENFKPELLERNLLSHYSATNLKELPYKHGAGEDPAHVTQVKNFD